jgi:hypothetical protein
MRAISGSRCVAFFSHFGAEGVLLMAQAHQAACAGSLDVIVAHLFPLLCRCRVQGVHALDIPGHRYQAPLTLRLVQSAPAHLAQAHDRLDDSKHRLDRLLAQALYLSWCCAPPIVNPLKASGSMTWITKRAK